MHIEPKAAIIAVGSIGGAYLFGALLWSIIFPDKRFWPPKQSTIGLKVRVWSATIAIFLATFLLGLIEWNNLQFPLAVRLPIGVPLIVLGHFVVWAAVAKIGFGATSGEVDQLKTDGLYAYSRNPQYVADMAILIGWAILSASMWAIIFATIGVLVLVVAPLSEEPWLEENYGRAYRTYRSKVRRFL